MGEDALLATAVVLAIIAPVRWTKWNGNMGGRGGGEEKLFRACVYGERTDHTQH